jgi:hypothetical protein
MNIGGVNVKKWLAKPKEPVVEEKENYKEKTNKVKDNPSLMESIVLKSLNPTVSSHEEKEYKQ